jgi:hypothetical protein
MVKDFVPARANLSTGITISSPVLERNKFPYANPSSTSKIEEYTGTIDGPTITTEYTDLYDGLGGDKMAYYNGSITGSIIEYGDEWIAKNFNPYLLPTASLTATDINYFNHSEFNVLLNNVSQSVLSSNRRLLQPIYVKNSPLSLAGYSSSYFAELQDSYETLTTYNNARYDGTKISSLLYNTYTSASSTYAGDNSYGKTATTDKQVRQIGLFTEIVSSSFLPKRNRVSLKYIVDEFGGLTELNQRNKHWEDIQRTFIAGDIFNISQFDNQKFGNQKTTDGDKLIFDSGYSYYPILYFTGSCDGTQKIYFENLGGSNAYRATAENVSSSYFISGSSPLGFPVVGGVVKNIFNFEIEDLSSVYSPGTLNSFPSYSATEGGGYNVKANFDMTVTLPDGNEASWSLQVYKSSSVVAETLLFESENLFSNPLANVYRVFFTTGSINNGSLCNYIIDGNAVAGWSDKDPFMGNYLTTGDSIFTNRGLTTARAISGYVMQWIDASSPVGQVYNISNGQFGNLLGPPAC